MITMWPYQELPQRRGLNHPKRWEGYMIVKVHVTEKSSFNFSLRSLHKKRSQTYNCIKIEVFEDSLSNLTRSQHKRYIYTRGTGRKSLNYFLA